MQEIAGIPKIANRNLNFLALQKLEFQIKKFDWNLWNCKRNWNSASNGGPRNRNQKLEFPTWGTSSRVTPSSCYVCWGAIQFAQQGGHQHAFRRGANSYILNFAGPPAIPSFVQPFAVIPQLPPGTGSHAKLSGCNVRCSAIQFGLQHGYWYAFWGGGFFLVGWVVRQPSKPLLGSARSRHRTTTNQQW